MRWQKDARTKFDHLPPAFCRCSVSGKLSTSSSRFPQGICFPSPLKGKAKALSPARKQKISSLCSEIFGKNPPNAKRSPLRYGSWSPVGTGKTDRRDSGEQRWTRATGTQRRLSCGKYRASSGSNEVRAAFARGLELRVLYKLSAKESGEKILER